MVYYIHALSCDKQKQKHWKSARGNLPQPGSMRADFFMKIKCLLGHDWDIWQECNMNHYVFQKEKQEYKNCLHCHKIIYRPLPRLPDRIEYALETRDRDYIERCLNVYEKEYGTHAFNKGMTEIALRHFKVRTHDYKHEINKRVVEYYLTTVDKSFQSVKM